MFVITTDWGASRGVSDRRGSFVGMESQNTGLNLRRVECGLVCEIACLFRLKSVEEALKVIEEAISDDATRGKIARSLHELSDRVRRKQHKQGALRDWKRVVDRLDDASVSPEYAALIRSGKVQSVFANSIERVCRTVITTRVSLTRALHCARPFKRTVGVLL